MRSFQFGLILVFAVVAFTGCPKPQPANDAAAASATAQPGNPATGRESQSQTQTPSGASGSVPETAKSPAAWPADLPQYPGSQISESTTNTMHEALFMAVMMKTPDSADQVLAYYEKAALAAGYVKKVTIKLPAGGGSSSYEDATKSLSVKADHPVGETLTSVQLLLKFKSDPTKSQAPPTAGTPGK
jgi:hypothetical protein